MFRKIVNHSKISKFIIFLGLILFGSIILSGAVSAASNMAIQTPTLNHYDKNSSVTLQTKNSATKLKPASMKTVSATKVIGHGSSHKHIYPSWYITYSWKAVSYNKYHVKINFQRHDYCSGYPNLNSNQYMIIDIIKKNSRSIRMTAYYFDSVNYHKYNFTDNVKGGNAFNYYKSNIKAYLKAYYHGSIM